MNERVQRQPLGDPRRGLVVGARHLVHRRTHATQRADDLGVTATAERDPAIVEQVVAKYHRPWKLAPACPRRAAARPGNRIAD
jgi:hypothetical protein